MAFLVMASMESGSSATSSPATKVVLACFGHHKREVNFSSSYEAAHEIKNLKQAFLATFSDVLESAGAEEKNVVVQVKSELWCGEFVDIAEDHHIQDHSVVQVVLTSPGASVSYVL